MTTALSAGNGATRWTSGCRDLLPYPTMRTTLTPEQYSDRARRMTVDQLFSLIHDVQASMHRAKRQDEIDGGTRIWNLEREMRAYRAEIVRRA